MPRSILYKEALQEVIMYFDSEHGHSLETLSSERTLVFLRSGLAPCIR